MESRGAVMLVAAAVTLGFHVTALYAQTPIEIDMTSIDFGTVNVGNTTAPRAVTLTNTDPSNSFGPLNIFGGAPPTPEFGASQNCQGATLAPGGTCNFNYTFSPSAPGTFNDASNFTISETANQADGESFSVSLTGVGVNPITAAPLSHDFGNVNVGSTSAPMSTVITNTSGDPFGPLNIFGGAPPTAEFDASQNCQGATLAPGGICSIDYTFSPSAPGTFVDTSNFTISATANPAAGEDFSVDLTGCAGEPCPSNRATFAVEKDFTDDNPAGVEVTISCNNGLPLEQSKVITEGDPVTFVVTEFDTGELDCSVTEAVPAGYAASYDDGSPAEDNCSFADVGSGVELPCAITNGPLPVEVEVTKLWFDEQLGEAIPEADAFYECFAEMFESTFGGLHFEGVEDTESFEVFPHWNGGTTCTIEERVEDSSVESDDSDCQQLSVTLGQGASCTITNTRFFEGIPALNPFGLAGLALLLVWSGWIAFRRYA